MKPSISSINVLVIFASCSGRTEKLALAAAVGAVQARANIRIRRLPDSGEDRPEFREALDRMRLEYVSPAQADVVWADAVIIGAHGTIAGAVTNPPDATAFARNTTIRTRELKEFPERPARA